MYPASLCQLGGFVGQLYLYSSATGAVNTKQGMRSGTRPPQRLMGGAT